MFLIVLALAALFIINTAPIFFWVGTTAWITIIAAIGWGAFAAFKYCDITGVGLSIITGGLACGFTLKCGNVALGKTFALVYFPTLLFFVLVKIIGDKLHRQPARE